MRKLVPFFLILLLLLPALASAQDNHPPGIKVHSVTSSQNFFKSTYLLQITYTDIDNNPPHHVTAVVNNETFSMSPINYLDTNYSDGKRYYAEVDLGKGLYSVYFEVSDGINTTITDPFLLQVPGYFDTEHGDLAKAIFLLTPVGVVLVLLIVYQGWKLTKTVDKLAGKKRNERKGEAGKGEEEKEVQKEEGNEGIL